MRHAGAAGRFMNHPLCGFAQSPALGGEIPFTSNNYRYGTPGKFEALKLSHAFGAMGKIALLCDEHTDIGHCEV